VYGEKYLSLREKIGSPSVYEPLYQTLCITLEVVCIRAGFGCKLFRFSYPSSPWFIQVYINREYGRQILLKYVYYIIINDVNLNFFFNCQFWHNSKSNNSDYSLKPISELVANAKQRTIRSLSIIILTMKKHLY
jgi:hypothetical protein